MLVIETYLTSSNQSFMSAFDAVTLIYITLDDFHLNDFQPLFIA